MPEALAVGVVVNDARVNAQEASIQAVVIRCTCGAPESHFGAVCPRGASTDLGTVSYWHRNPLKRWAFALNQKFGGR